MKCISCKGNNGGDDTGTCNECSEELKAKVAFLTTSQPASFSDVVLVAVNDVSADNPVQVPAHKAVLVSRSPVFRAMLENEMEENLGGTIRIADVSYDALRAFVNYMYTAEICLDQRLAFELLTMAEKYQVQHLKDYCHKFLVSNLNWDNSLTAYTSSHQHNAKRVTDAALALITDNLDKLTAREEYAELKEKHPQLLFEIYEASVAKQVNAASQKDTPEVFSFGLNTPVGFSFGRSTPAVDTAEVQNHSFGRGPRPNRRMMPSKRGREPRPNA